MTENQKRRVQIEFIFPKDELHKDERLQRARDVIFDPNHQGEIIGEMSEILPDGKEEYTILAEVPAHINVLSKKFDTPLNRLYIRGGAEAAYVRDAQ